MLCHVVLRTESLAITLQMRCLNKKRCQAVLLLQVEEEKSKKRRAKRDKRRRRDFKNLEDW